MARHPRDDVKRRFREGKADVLLCTDAAAEGLNFQFCGALVNYDMPWNPMRVEQRIGRIDRLGQRYPIIRIVNLHYADTVEADVYQALRERIGLVRERGGSPATRFWRVCRRSSPGESSKAGQSPRDERQAVVADIESAGRECKPTGSTSMRSRTRTSQSRFSRHRR